MTAADQPAVIRVAVAHFPPTAAAVPEVRARTTATLLGWSVDTDTVGTVELVVGEITSNAVKVSRPQDVLAVRLTATRGQVVVEVWDSSNVGPEMKSPDVFSEDGRGLVLVDALCSSWSWYRVKSGGKVVWGEVPGGLRPETAGAGVALPARAPLAVPEPAAPVVYRTDPQTLRRVADALRGLDPWHWPPPSQRAPEAVTGVARRPAT
ncbi:ATP-binding protein [Frankia sp. CcI156]|uniref:Signal transduction histidine kinase n=1 Tax=Frankia casuarinae (strain DSM 45818 / CECT 9043 / HFP020203 / CcI3) TaxID=106370 RepID=Q2J9I1_FRACC|nr:MULTISPECIES: ATP-binding protein [Frankia]ABD12061.1 putative signal transduction histidine kinase [Frankia casuarinae]ETA01996.1 hypothetical protein CcI6DRAFT_02519 [Frankia sp. CcI6]EYT90108.1 hypothetical protein ThrDRAFT_04278 [Frankia casuarinae]KFB04201.1 Histidine kinase-like ATPase domain [Frankia sp. Allo2]OHV53701.1 ATPase [Frankia sp. CgIS1]